ncbi:hypothetical protein DPMN_062529 [Dreissena polymorpha]|uniref:Uncharacterized protein n=1 Tax=Dreissena polymorpha TaxID=45954 RepID=A0A9D4HHU5_DREPO|nr:hypothetical protein DPMN_062529 [Dreissena polymorpha]
MSVRLGVHGQGTSRHHYHGQVTIVSPYATRFTRSRYLTTRASRSSVYCLCQCDSVYLAKVPHGTTFTVKCLLSLPVRLGVHGQGNSRQHLHGQVSIVYACATRCTWPRYLTSPPSRLSVYCLCQCDSVYLVKVPHGTSLKVKVNTTFWTDIEIRMDVIMQDVQATICRWVRKLRD